MPTPAEQVDSVFSQAVGYANAAKTALASFTTSLDAALYTPPSYSFNWSTIAPPTLPTLPNAPVMPTILFNDPGGQPMALTEDIPTLTIADFTELAPSLTIPNAPTISYGAVPAVPAVGTVDVPVAPTVTMPALPTYLTLNPVTFSGLNLREDLLAKLETIPTLDIVSPTPYSYALGPKYASQLLSGLQAKLLERLNGGTGLPAAVEQAIWDRARTRETQIAQANIDEVTRAGDALGYHLPAGAMAAQLRQAQQDYYDKLSSLSRDVAIKQAELEQENLKQTIAAGMQLESQLIDYSYKIEQLTFESAKQYADNAVQLHNAAIEQYRTLLSGYQTYVQNYKTIIDSQLAKVEVFKAQLAGEQAKADVNKTLVEQYKAGIEAGMAQVEIYRAQVGAAQTLVQLEQAKIGAAGEQIRAFVAQVNAETAKVEAYKASVQAEATKVEIYKTKADVYSSQVGAQAERSRALISRYTALVQAKAGEWDGYRAKVSAESERIRALGIQSSTLLDSYKAAVSSIQAQGEMMAKVWESNIKQYEAGQQTAIAAARLNHDSVIQTNNARLDAAKVGAQVYAQLTSSAYSMIHASAGVSASGGTSVSYSYGGDVNGTVTPIPSI